MSSGRRRLSHCASADEQSSTTTSSSGISDSSSRAEFVQAKWKDFVASLLRLLLTVWGLIIFPATLFCDFLTPRVWSLSALYYAFFLGGTLMRLLRYGRLTGRGRDAQRSTCAYRRSLRLFIAAMPVCHWWAAWVYGALGMPIAASGAAKALDLFGWALAAGACLLNWSAAEWLGRSYDRVSAPDLLVTGGPYAHIQHPIYTSYMLLFLAYGILLCAPLAGMVLVAVCAVYYRQRTQLEENILLAEFGSDYASYRQATGKYLPKLL